MEDVVWEERPVLLDPVAVIAYEGWGDAGESASGAAGSLLDQLAGFRFATIDPERYFDFQVARPLVELDETGTRNIEWPDTEFHAVSASSRDLVVVTGMEPHTMWKTYTAQVIAVLRELGVSEVLTMGAFIGEVAHSVPVPLVGVSNEPEMIETHNLIASGYEGPTGIIGVLNAALAADGFTVLSVWAAVPHYLTSQEYPPGALALFDKIVEFTGIDVDRSELALAADDFKREVDEAIDDPEMRSYVADLESQALADDSGADPGERLLDEIERFLRDS